MKCLGCKQSLEPGIFLSYGVRRADLKNLLGLPLRVCVCVCVPACALCDSLATVCPSNRTQNDKTRPWGEQEGLGGLREGAPVTQEWWGLLSYYLILVGGSPKSQGKCAEHSRVEAKVPESGMEVWGVDPCLACPVTQ